MIDDKESEEPGLEDKNPEKTVTVSPGQGGKIFSRKLEKQKKAQSTAGGNARIRFKNASNSKKSSTKEEDMFPN